MTNTPANIELDEKDLKILEMLTKNARIPYCEIAKAIGISDVAVMKRIRKLEQSGIIKGYTAIIDPKKLGYNLVSITGIDVEPQYLFKVVEELKNIMNIKYIAVTSGDHNIMTVIWAKNGDEIAKIHSDISKLPGIRRVCPAIILEVFKDEKI